MDNEIRINDRIRIPLGEVELDAIRAQGPGGQNVNKVSSAFSLRFDINTSSLPESYKARLMKARDRRITSAGVVVIKAQRYRTQEKNRSDALERLAELVRKHTAVSKKRKPTKPSKASKRRRLESKQRRGRLKTLRTQISTDC